MKLMKIACNKNLGRIWGQFEKSQNMQKHNATTISAKIWHHFEKHTKTMQQQKQQLIGINMGAFRKPPL